MDGNVIIYEKSTCSKCRETKKILEEAGIDFKTVLYYETPLKEAKIKNLLKKLGMEPIDLIRRGEDSYKKYNIGKRKYTNGQLIKFLADNPDLIQRPIVEVGDRAVLGRPPENVRELL